MNNLRRAVARQLDPGLHPGRGVSIVNRLIAGIIVLTCVLVVLETEDQIYRNHIWLFGSFELFLLILFSVEYALRVWSCVENPAHPSRLRYCLRPTMLIDLFVIFATAWAVVGADAAWMRLLRLVRLLRIIKLGRFSTAMQDIGRAVRDRRFELLASLSVAGLLLLISATALYVVEGEGQPEAFGSIPRAMWWAIATLTTVGYGDVVPATALGRVFAALTALMGVGLIAMPAGILAAAFSTVVEERRTQKDERD